MATEGPRILKRAVGAKTIMKCDYNGIKDGFHY